MTSQAMFAEKLQTNFITQNIMYDAKGQYAQRRDFQNKAAKLKYSKYMTCKTEVLHQKSVAIAISRVISTTAHRYIILINLISLLGIGLENE